MRHLLAVLAAAIALAPIAHAATVDDFVLTSTHHVYTFFLTTPYDPGYTPDQHYNNFPEFGPGTIDGVGGYTLGGYFWVNNCCGRYGLNFELPGNYTYQLVGSDLDGYSTPFLTGTFDYTDFAYDILQSTTVLEDGPYTLTITPETSTSVTPEPATLTLLATGALGLLTRLRRRRLA